MLSNNRKVQRARPLGGLEQAKAISLASFSPSKIRATAGVARCLRLNTVAVGTLVSQRPPLRSVRAELPHTALALGHDAYLGFGCG